MAATVEQTANTAELDRGADEALSQYAIYREAAEANGWTVKTFEEWMES